MGGTGCPAAAGTLISAVRVAGLSMTARCHGGLDHAATCFAARPRIQEAIA